MSYGVGVRCVKADAASLNTMGVFVMNGHKVGDILTVVEIGSFAGSSVRVKFDDGTRATVQYNVIPGDKFKVVMDTNYKCEDIIDYELID